MNGNRLEIVKLGASIETIDKNAFANCPYILSVYANMEFPPIIDSSVFANDGDLSLVNLYVLESAYVRYKKNRCMEGFRFASYARSRTISSRNSDFTHQLHAETHP